MKVQMQNWYEFIAKLNNKKLFCFVSGHILIVDFSASRSTWQSLFSNRLAGKFSRDVRGRIKYYTPLDQAEILRVSTIVGHTHAADCTASVLKYTCLLSRQVL